MSDKPMRVLIKLWATREKTMEEWQRFNNLYHLPEAFKRQYKPTRLKWGHPGRNRRRKARLLARTVEAKKVAAFGRWLAAYKLRTGKNCNPLDLAAEPAVG